MRTPGTALAATIVVAALLAPTTASADTVTTLADSGAGSLRAAVAAGGTVTFASGLEGTIVLAGQLEIDKNLTIDGPGARKLTVSGGDATRVFHVSGAGVEARIRDLTIRDGTVPNAAPIGAGVLADGNAALLRLERVTVVDNEASSTVEQPLGGGVAVVDGKLELVDSTVAGNRAPGGGGGGVMVGVPATFEIVNSTIAGNSSSVGAGVVAVSSTGTIAAATLAGNTAAVGGPAIGSFGEAVSVERSLITGNGPQACAGTVTSAGGNVIDTACFDTPDASDAEGATAPVGALGPNGGPTDTLLPLAGSAAIDHVACTGADQRAVARPQGAACDAGAVETRPARLVASGPLALGSATVGQQSAPASVTITNEGDYDATINGVSLAGTEVEPVADPDACTDAMVLGPGETCTLKARLSPTSPGMKTATYSVAMAGSVLDVPITGTGDAAPPPPSDPGTGGSPSNPPPTPSADAALVGTSAKAKRGKLKLRLRCTTVSADRCAGSLTLKLGARKLTKTYSIAAGKDAFVTLKLKPGERRKLARKSLKSAVTVVTKQPDGTRRTTHQGSFKLLRG
jgi:hypothetical protein